MRLQQARPFTEAEIRKDEAQRVVERVKERLGDSLNVEWVRRILDEVAGITATPPSQIEQQTGADR